MVVAEIFKQYYHQGLRPRLCFFRDSTGNEVDLVIEQGNDLALIEIKSGQTVSNQFFSGLDCFYRFAGDRVQGGAVIYGGDRHQSRSDWEVWPVKDLDQMPEAIRSFFAD